MKLRLGLFTAATMAVLFSCAKEPDGPILIDSSGFATKTDTTKICTLQYPDGQLTLNDRCPVRKGGLNVRMPAIYVNQQPIGFC